MVCVGGVFDSLLMKLCRCWIAAATEIVEVQKDTEISLLRFFAFYIPLWAILLVNTVLYILIFRSIRRQLKQLGAAPSDAAMNVRRLFFYPIVMLLAWLFPSVNRIQNWIAPAYPNFILFSLHSFFSALMGFLNCLAFLSDPVVLGRIRQRFTPTKTVEDLEMKTMRLLDSDETEGRKIYEL